MSARGNIGISYARIQNQKKSRRWYLRNGRGAHVWLHRGKLFSIILNRRHSFLFLFIEFYREGEYLVKYEGLTYDASTWESISSPLLSSEEGLAKIASFQERKSSRRARRKSSTAPRKFQELKAMPACLNHGTALALSPQRIQLTGSCSIECKLHPYQLDGINWLLYTWSTHTNAILADEMGKSCILRA